MSYNDICPVEADLNRYLNSIDEIDNEKERKQYYIDRITEEIIDEWTDGLKSFDGAKEVVESKWIDSQHILALMVSSDPAIREAFLAHAKCAAPAKAVHEVEQKGLKALEGYYECD